MLGQYLLPLSNEYFLSESGNMDLATYQPINLFYEKLFVFVGMFVAESKSY